jgi:hypothetical protein
VTDAELLDDPNRVQPRVTTEATARFGASWIGSEDERRSSATCITPA